MPNDAHATAKASAPATCGATERFHRVRRNGKRFVRAHGMKISAPRNSQSAALKTTSSHRVGRSFSRAET